MAEDSKESIFQKVYDMSTSLIDNQILKAKRNIIMNSNFEDDFFYAKAVTEEPSYSIHTSGWKEKPTRLQNSHLKQVSIKNTVATAVSQTRQNHVAGHSKLVKSEQEKGHMIKLKNEDELLEEIKVQLREEQKQLEAQGVPSDTESEGIPEPATNDEIVEKALKSLGMRLKKADPINDVDDETNPDNNQQDSEQNQDELNQEAQDKGMDDDEVETYNFELERKAKEILRKKFEKDKKAVEEWIAKCGHMENRPFDKKKWNFDAALRAWTRDTLTYDMYATEIVPDGAGRPHYWFPTDAGTIKFSSIDLAKYKQLAENFLNLDILYPERQVKAMEKQKVLELNDDLLEKEAYKYVQVIRGKIERAYTEDELKVGIRNITTDIYNNGYGLSEIELCVSLITGHLNAEFYNQAYFTQGFSAKGILHIKAAINRRKLESVRQQWQHMLRGSKNSFQTPIFAGVNEVQWIPLTQNHDDIGFEGWMRYLIKMICSIFQIDPHEIGIGFKDEGGGGGGISGDNTQEKIRQSKDKGLVPLLRHIEAYINEKIIASFDDRFVLEFTGLSDEDRKEAQERQALERIYKKTVNEIRAEDGLPPLPGMDDVILGPEYMQWYAQFSKAAIEAQEKMMQQQQDQMDGEDGEDEAFNFDEDEESMYNDQNLETQIMRPEDAEEGPNNVAKAVAFANRINKKNLALHKSMLRKNKNKKKAKKLKIEYYRIK